MNIRIYLLLQSMLVISAVFDLKRKEKVDPSKYFFPFQPISNADFIVPVEIDGTIHQVYVLKRPYVDDFLQKMGELYECVLFTASLAKVGGLFWFLVRNAIQNFCDYFINFGLFLRIINFFFPFFSFFLW